MGDSEIVAVGDTKTAAPGAVAEVKTVEKEETPEGMFKMAQMLHKGTDDMKADLSRAVCLYQSALEQGYMDARAPLLEILAATPAATPEELASAREFMGISDDVDDMDEGEKDEGTVMVEEAASLEISDPEKAKHLYTTAIQEYDDPDAMNGLAILLEKSDAKRSIELYTTAMNNHAHCEAMFNLAVLLAKGAEGIDTDAKKAVELYEKVIEEEADTDAMNNLAELLQVGAEGVPADKKRAEFLFNEAKSLAHEPMEDDDEEGEANAEMKDEKKEDDKVEKKEEK